MVTAGVWEFKLFGDFPEVPNKSQPYTVEQLKVRLFWGKQRRPDVSFAIAGEVHRGPLTGDAK